jgi:hypothetical protein
MHRPLPSIVLALVAAVHFSTAAAQTVSQAANWCQQAEANLTDRAGLKISCQQVAKRCVRMNNLWCQKHGSSPWRGTPKPDGKDGLSDVDGHAVFASADWSARAAAIDIKAKYKRGLTSALAIASQYSPWCDTLGSKAVVSGSGRTCKDGRAEPPSGFTGPLCEAPKESNPTTKSCKPGCNCPPQIAATLIKGITEDASADLQLFDKEGRPKENLTTFLRNLAIQEQGIYVRTELINAGIMKLSQ